MNTLNILANVSQNYIDYVVKSVSSIELGWLENIVKWIIGGVGITAVGIILFTLILKVITLPLDVFSRISTKKQSLVMKKMRPQMEKLQKQYANDKNMYNQKVMELYKKNGYSMFGACLPMIVTLIVFVFVIGAFSNYSQYSNLENYRGMVKAYNNSVINFVQEEGENGETTGFLLAFEGENQVAKADLNDEKTYNYKVDFDAFESFYNNSEYKLLDENGNQIVNVFEGKDTEDKKINVVTEYIKEPARQAAAEEYLKNNHGFLWIKNIWYPDSMINREIPSFADFRSSVSQAQFDEDYESSYNEVTANLQEQKETFNGYFILIVIAIGVMLLQQWIMMRSQKDANELSTVDGSAVQSNKMMMIIMPIMYGVFSFFYSASFSVYMITSSVFSLITTLIINKIMDSIFAKKEAEEEFAKYTNRSVPTYKRNNKNK